MTTAPERTSDRDCLVAWVKSRQAVSLQPIFDRYLPLVYASALRRLGNEAVAREVSLAAFLVLARRAKRLPKRASVPALLFEWTALAARKRTPRRWLRFFTRRSPRRPRELTPETLAAHLDRALDQMPRPHRAVLLVGAVALGERTQAATLLRLDERKLERRAKRAWRKLSARLKKHVGRPAPDTLRAAVHETLIPPAPVGLAEEALSAVALTAGPRPGLPLARALLRTLFVQRWRRRIVVGVPLTILFFGAIGATVWYVDSRTGHSQSLAWFLEWSVRREGKTIPGLAQPAKPWPSQADAPVLSAAALRDAGELYRSTNIWVAHLRFTREQWQALEPQRIGAMPHFFQQDGTVLLRNPQAQRSGLAGVLGFDFNWSEGQFEFGGVSFSNVAVRFKGNGTYLSSLSGVKRSFKVDLNDSVKGQKLAGGDELNFSNSLDDRSYLSDTLAYEFFRQAGVPAPRTAFAYLSVTVEKQWDRRPLGLYVMVEPMDEEFVAEWFGSKRTPLFKPVTYELFHYLGEDWNAYADIYDLKTRATPAQQRRVIEFARLLTQASDTEFAARVAEFLDLEAFARFLAGEVLLSCYDSFLSNGQNYYLYLDPRSNRFGFIPWDMDLAWGGFFLLGTPQEREKASIWRPWVGEHRLLERVMQVEAFREIYRRELERQLENYFVPEQLHERIDALAKVIRDAVAAESEFRLNKFDQAVGFKPFEAESAGHPNGANRPVHRLKRFIDKRAVFVREQLDGKSEGVVLRRRRG